MNDQAAKLRRKIETLKNPKLGKTICVISGKGGVGKSSVALNFALELINNSKKVLLFDLDVGMGNIDILLGLNAKKSIINLFNGDDSIYQIIEYTEHGLAYIAGGTGLNDFLSFDETKREYFMSQYNELINLYDYIIFDMGAGIQQDSLFFIMACDECIVVTTPEPTSITDAYSVIKHVVNHDGNMPIQVLMNKCFSQRGGEEALEHFKRVIRKFLQVDIIKMGILPEDKTVSQAVMKQVPYILNEQSNITKALKEVTFNYLNHTVQINTIKTKSNFIQKLKQLLSERD